MEPNEFDKKRARLVEIASLLEAENKKPAGEIRLQIVHSLKTEAEELYSALSAAITQYIEAAQAPAPFE